MSASHSFAPPSRQPEPPARMALARVELEPDHRDPPARTRVPALVGEGTRVLAVGAGSAESAVQEASLL